MLILVKIIILYDLFCFAHIYVNGRSQTGKCWLPDNFCIPFTVSSLTIGAVLHLKVCIIIV